MNYQAVYAAFIADRRAKEPQSGYYEVHHVVPRSFGGSDAPDNLIRLTPEDHLFAHLLLAKIHGGWMISAVFLMSGRTWNGRSSRALRSSYAMMRRGWAEYASTIPGKKGADNARYRHERFEWLNLDSLETRHATLGEMHAEFGCSRAAWTQVLSGAKPSVYGWVIAANKPRIRGLRNKQVQLVNVDGRTFTGTQKEFCAQYGVSFATASRMCRHGTISKCGWMVEGAQKPIPGRLNKGVSYRLTKGEEEVVLKRREAAQKVGSTASQFSAGAHAAIKTGSTYKGWKIAYA